MNSYQHSRYRARASGLRRVRVVTGWVAAAGLAVTVGLGAAFANIRAASAGSATSGTGQDDRTTGTGDGQDGRVTGDDSGTSTTLTPPTRAPRRATGGSGQVRSGGS